MKQLRNFRQDTQKKIENVVSSEVDPLLNEAIEKYSGLDEDGLVEQLILSVKKSKEDGTYDPKQMENYVSVLRPHLSSVQLEKLTNIITIINDENV